MKGYKGFSKGLICRNKKYEIGKVYEEDNAELCKSGMHYCENPLDVFGYYMLDENCDFCEFAEVEDLAPETASKNNDSDTKVATTRLKIKAKLTFADMIKAGIAFCLERSKEKTASGNYSQLATSGNRSQLAASGDCSQLAASGYDARLATSGDYSRLAASGNYSQLATSGDCSRLATSGNRSQLAASGYGSVVVGIGKENIAKATKGSWITLAEWEKHDGRYEPICVKTEYVDGDRIKANTFYELINGVFTEATNYDE